MEPSSDLKKIREGRKDLNELYEYFLRRSERERVKQTPGIKVIEESVDMNVGETASLMVIDMQDDFVLPTGRFSVANGLTMAPLLRKFIDENHEKFYKIIFTRDTHPIDHCSFFTNGGPFPPHCVINHQGAMFHGSMVDLQSLPNVDVVFKGCHNDADSFGAAQYKDMSYLRKRQLGNCCKEIGDDECSDKTGTFFLKTSSKKWDVNPFENAPLCDSTNHILSSDDCPGSLWGKIQDELGNTFSVSDIIPEVREGSFHYIFIVGLAGDYCVKDTAINLSSQIKEQGLENKVKIVVLQPFVRYACLPLEFVGGNQVYSIGEPLAKPSDFYKITEGDEKKDINHYIFQLGSQVRLLSKEEVKESEEYLNQIQPLVSSTNQNGYGSFLTPTRDIINDYANAGVTIAMNPPQFSSMGGNKRRNNRSTKRRKKSKNRKSKRKSKRSKKYRW